MKRNIFRSGSLITLLFLFQITQVSAKEQDSIGTKVKNGKVFIVHVVENGQGLYGIMRRYKVPIPEIVKHNPGSDKLIAPGQQLLIPTGKDAPFEEKIVKEYFDDPPAKDSKPVPQSKPVETATFAAFHHVESGETLYSISKMYQTTPEIIRELNQLDTDELSLGQKLIVPKVSPDKAENDVTVEKTPPVKEEVKEIETEENKPVEKKETETVVSKEEEAKPYEITDEVVEKHQGAYKKKVENLPEFDVEKITESGLATMLTADNSMQSKNVCSHYEAQVGTIIMVTNPTNNKAVFVKVISNFDFDPTKAEVIKMSKAAMLQVGLIEGPAAIEISYAR